MMKRGGVLFGLQHEVTVCQMAGLGNPIRDIPHPLSATLVGHDLMVRNRDTRQGSRDILMVLSRILWPQPVLSPSGRSDIKLL